MRIVEINAVNNGSTGNIMLQIADEARKNGMEVLICVPKSRSNMKKKFENQYYFGDRITRNLHILLAKYTGFQDCFSVIATLRLLKRITAFKPDVIHLHNLHGNYINLPMLFYYLKKHDVLVVWTLHDCWSFTGQCSHFTMAKCEKWKTGCHDCMQYKNYPSSKIDRTKKMWYLKKKWFTDVKYMTIITPSNWLRSLLKESYLKEYPIQVIHNGIDLNIFKPTESNFRQKYHISDEQYVLLGVSFGWGKQKGLDVFIDLAIKLDDRFQIVLVGTDEVIDKQLPDNIISIHKTNNQKKLAEVYTAADLFVNPTREENYPTVNMEAIACGTPVVTFNTGGSPEIITEKTGIIVDDSTADKLCEIIINEYEHRNLDSQKCLEKALEFDKIFWFKKYIQLFMGEKLYDKK